MNKVTIFKYEENKLVRTMNVSGEPCAMCWASVPRRG